MKLKNFMLLIILVVTTLFVFVSAQFAQSCNCAFVGFALIECRITCMQEGHGRCQSVTFVSGSCTGFYCHPKFYLNCTDDTTYFWTDPDGVPCYACGY